MSAPIGRPPSREPIRQDLDYQVPLTDRVKLGGTPRDYFDANPQPAADLVPCSGGACSALPQEVWVTNPLLSASGAPLLESVHESVDARAASPLLNGLGWGAAGAALGGIVGAVVGVFLGSPGVGASVGAALTAPLAGAVAARSAARDQVALEWVERPIVQTDLTGYRERVSPGRLHGKDGYFHRFEPVLASRPLGTYHTPQIVHSESAP